MTYYEKFISEHPEYGCINKDVFASGIGLVDGEITECEKTSCSKCGFGKRLTMCTLQALAYLDKEVENE